MKAKRDWTPGQNLFAALFPWTEYYDEPPEVDEERIWEVVARYLKPRELLAMEILYGRRPVLAHKVGHRPLTMQEAASVMPRADGPGTGVDRSRIYDLRMGVCRKLLSRNRREALREAVSAETWEKANLAHEKVMREIEQKLGQDSKGEGRGDYRRD